MRNRYAIILMQAMLPVLVAAAKGYAEELVASAEAGDSEGRGAWELSTGSGEPLPVVQDRLLNREVLSLEGGWAELRSREAVTPPYTVEAVIRLMRGVSRGASPRAVLRTGAAPLGEQGLGAAYSLALNAPSRGSEETNQGAELYALRSERVKELLTGGREFAAANGEAFAAMRVVPRFGANAISPIWDPDFRRAVIRDMAEIPLTTQTWARVRLAVDETGRARAWCNGFVFADYRQPTNAAGRVSLRMFGPMRLAWLRVTRGRSGSGHFVPLPLDQVANASGFVALESLPGAPGETTDIQGVPFERLPSYSRGDHVDVGRSVFRYRMHEGFRDHNSPNATVIPSQLDPARIRLFTPKAPITRLWLLAAADNETNSVPMVTARFYRNEEGYPLDFSVRTPLFSATSGEGARRVPGRMQDGGDGALWVLPIDVNALQLNSEFRDETVYELELTKQIHDFRAFPDPTMYTSYPGGLPSAVRIYGLTAEVAPFAAISSGDLPGNVYAAEDKVVWQVSLESWRPEPQTVDVTIEVTDPYGQSVKTYTRQVQLPGGETAEVRFEPELGPRGLYSVRTVLRAGPEVQTNLNTFVSLPPDTRKADAKTSRWGIYYWGGGHDTHRGEMRNMEILHEIGARTGAGNRRPENLEARRKWGIGPATRLLVRRIPEWARETPIDPAKREAWQKEVVEKLNQTLEWAPDLEHVSFFAESSVSLRLTHGMPPEGIGESYYALDELTDAEKQKMRWIYETASAGLEVLSKSHPHIQLDFGHAAPLFTYPFFRHAEALGFDMRKFRAYGLDSPQFERMPERQPRATEPSLMYFSNKLYAEHDLHDRVHLAHTESFFPPSHRLGAGKQGQARIIVRTAVHALAWGTDVFESALGALYVPADYWGTSHYGAAGLIGPGPEFDPFPALPAYAAMTEMLDLFDYSGWLDVGSRSSYALRFRRRDGSMVYCVYTLRGRRPLVLTARPGTSLSLLDGQGNRRALEVQDGSAELTLSPDPVWVLAQGGELIGARVGRPEHAAGPGPHAIVLEDFENGAWRFSDEPEPGYAENHWDIKREPAPMTAALVRPDGRDSQAMRVTMGDVAEDRLLLRRYGVFVPEQPIAIPGKARSLGISVNGDSSWKRVIYEIEDAEGEIYRNVGTKDAWNCDDIHSWSSVTFDGWRFMEFPLPGNLPGDHYREKDSVWWGHSGGDGDGVVDLPLRLNKIIVEMSTHQIYIDQMLEVPGRTLELDELVAVYDSAEMMTDAPIALQRSAADAYAVGDVDAAWLPNPIARLKQAGLGDAPRIVSVYPPEDRRDGTRVYVEIGPVDEAKRYRVYVSTDPDGSGAMALGRAREAPNVVYLSGLQPSIPMYFFATYINEANQESKPSPPRKTVLRDEFPMK